MLAQGLINLINENNIKCCKMCRKEKTLMSGFYLKMICFDGGNYNGYFQGECIDCMCQKSKKKGKFYQEKESEKMTGWRKCQDCGFLKKLNDINFQKVQSKYFRRVCLKCVRKRGSEYNKTRDVNKRNESQKKYQKKRRKRDPVYRLRKYISTSIYKALRKNNGKKESSIMNFLPYIIEELKQHLENQFEWWMNWNNMGKYNAKTWNDQNSTTWVWNLDHIIPQSLLPFSSMKEENFIKCWALQNLRPFNAKQNIMEGNRLNRKQ
jgi:hypothetical protein